MSVKFVDGVIVPLTPAEEAEKAARAVMGEVDAARRSKVRAIKAEGLTRIAAQLPDVETFDDVKLLKKFGPAFQLSVKGSTAKDIYQYAVGQIAWINASDLATVQAYDPSTDPGWPA